jgi:hypothetical protein
MYGGISVKTSQRRLRRLGHKRDFQRAYRAGLRDAINQLAQLTQAETDERKRLLLEERRAQFQTALHNNPVT